MLNGICIASDVVSQSDMGRSLISNYLSYAQIILARVPNSVTAGASVVWCREIAGIHTPRCPSKGQRRAVSRVSKIDVINFVNIVPLVNFR